MGLHIYALFPVAFQRAWELDSSQQDWLLLTAVHGCIGLVAADYCCCCCCCCCCRQQFRYPRTLSEPDFKIYRQGCVGSGGIERSSVSSCPHLVPFFQAGLPCCEPRTHKSRRSKLRRKRHRVHSTRLRNLLSFVALFCSSDSDPLKEPMTPTCKTRGACLHNSNGYVFSCSTAGVRCLARLRSAV